MIRLSGARCLAMSLVGALFGWWASVDDLSTMTHYRALSHDALLTELARKNDGQVSTSIMAGLFVVLAVRVLVVSGAVVLAGPVLALLDLAPLKADRSPNFFLNRPFKELGER